MLSLHSLACTSASYSHIKDKYKERLFPTSSHILFFFISVRDVDWTGELNYSLCVYPRDGF